jgi:hypothetical protein
MPALSPDVPDHDLLRELKRGTFGAVHVARNRHDRSFCAVKILFADKQEVERAAIEHYQRIGKDHPFLVPIYHFGQAAEDYYYTMPLADDFHGPAPFCSVDQYEPHTLHLDHQRRAPLPLDEVLTIAEHLLAALELLHQHGLVHCDVKPENVLRVGGDWRLGDVGILVPRDRLALYPTRGTRWFRPPEGPTDFRADLYGLGKTLFLLATGEPRPGDGDPDPIRAFAANPARGAAADERWPELRTLLLCACHDQADKRFGSAREMATRVRDLVGKTRVILVLKRAYESFTPADADAVLRALRSHGIEGKLIAFSPGSVRLSLELTPTQSVLLRHAAQSGQLAHLEVVSVEPVEDKATVLRQLESAFDVVGAVLGPDEGNRLVGPPEPLLASLQETLRQPRGLVVEEAVPLHPVATRGARPHPRPPRPGVLERDPLYLRPVAGGGPVMETAPLWLTDLLAAPDQLAWQGALDAGPWRVCLDGPGGPILNAVVDRPALLLSDAVRRALPERVVLRWEAWPAQASTHTKPLVRGVFQILPADDSASVAGKLKELRAHPSGPPRDLALAGCYLGAGLYDDLVRHLRMMETLYVDRGSAFIIRRTLAATFWEMSRQLMGPAHIMGDPEGLWAAQLATDYLRAAYHVLGAGPA